MCSADGAISTSAMDRKNQRSRVKLKVHAASSSIALIKLLKVELTDALWQILRLIQQRHLAANIGDGRSRLEVPANENLASCGVCHGTSAIENEKRFVQRRRRAMESARSRVVSQELKERDRVRVSKPWDSQAEESEDLPQKLSLATHGWGRSSEQGVQEQALGASKSRASRASGVARVGSADASLLNCQSQSPGPPQRQTAESGCRSLQLLAVQTVRLRQQHRAIRSWASSSQWRCITRRLRLFPFRSV